MEQKTVNNRSWNKRRWDYENGIAKRNLLSGKKTALLFFISRKTLGFQKVSDQISLSQVREAIGGSRRVVRKLISDCHEDHYIIYGPGLGRNHLSRYTVQEDQARWTKTCRITSQFEEFLSKKGKEKGVPRGALLKGVYGGARKGDHGGPEKECPVVPHNTLTIPLTIENQDQENASVRGCVTPPTQDRIIGRDDNPQPDPAGSGLNESESNEPKEQNILRDQYPKPKCAASTSPRRKCKDADSQGITPEQIDELAWALWSKINERSMMGPDAVTIEDAQARVIKFIAGDHDTFDEVLHKVDHWDERDWGNIFSWKEFDERFW